MPQCACCRSTRKYILKLIDVGRAHCWPCPPPTTTTRLKCLDRACKSVTALQEKRIEKRCPNFFDGCCCRHGGPAEGRHTGWGRGQHRPPPTPWPSNAKRGFMRYWGRQYCSCGWEGGWKCPSLEARNRKPLTTQHAQTSGTAGAGPLGRAKPPRARRVRPNQSGPVQRRATKPQQRAEAADINTGPAAPCTQLKQSAHGSQHSVAML